MMSVWELPIALEVGDQEWNIRYDFRAILDILKYFQDPEYEQDEKEMICLDILYVDFANMPYDLYEEALEKAVEFIDMGIKDDSQNQLKVMDWEQDAPLITSAINGVLRTEIRSPQPLHWWTFLGAYMEIRESLFSDILSIRHKKAKGKKLEKWEEEFYKENKSLINLKNRKSERSQEEQEALRKLFGIKR